MLRNRLLAVLRSEAGPAVIVDLTRTPYVDCSGIAILIEALKIARNRNVALRLTGLQGRHRSGNGAKHRKARIFCPNSAGSSLGELCLRPLMARVTAVEVHGNSLLVRRTSGQHLKTVTFTINGREDAAIEQNQEEPSR